MNTDSEPQDDLSEEVVVAYLQSHPQLLKRHPELLEVLVPPVPKHGGNVVDFQSFALNSLQQNVQSLKDKFNGLLSSARDNMSVQNQVHQAALQILRARDLEHLLEVLTMDLLRYFDVDAVRLVIESEMTEFYDATYGDQAYGGIGFVPIDTVDMALGTGKLVALVADTQNDPPYAYDSLFDDCGDMVQSCAMLRIHLETIDRMGILAFGVREKGRFHSHLAVDLLRFLADIVALRLNQCLREHEIEKLL